MYLLFTSERAKQRARKALFNCVVTTKLRYHHESKKALNDNRRTELGRIKTTELFFLFDYVITQTVQAQCTICSIQGIMEQDLNEKSV